MQFSSKGDIFDKLRPFIQRYEIGESFLQHPNYYGLYYDIGMKMKPRGILEIGVRFGYSALSMILGCEGKTNFIGIDAEMYNPGSNSVATESIKSVIKGTCSIDNINTAHIKSINLSHEFKPDIIHVDACHTELGMIHDLNLVLPHMNDHTALIVDDMNHPGHQGLGAACDEFARENGLSVDTYDSLTGTKVLTK
tara:strand:+ start:2322 stop:2906 length:585 start_codon:yes stop_codon:yes gene_type:complete